MRRTLLIVGLAALAALVLVASPAAAQEDERRPHPPIKIYFDNWEECGCTTGGSGTAEDPWIVEDLTIIAARHHAFDSCGPGIEIWLSEEHAVFRNITIVDSDSVEAEGETCQRAVFMRESGNVTFRDISVENRLGLFSIGLQVLNSRNVAVHNAEILDPPESLEIGDVNQFTLTDSRFTEGDVFTGRTHVHNVTWEADAEVEMCGGTVTDVQAADLELTSLPKIRHTAIQVCKGPDAPHPLTVKDIRSESLETGNYPPFLTPRGGPGAASFENVTVTQGGFSSSSDLMIRNASVAGHFRHAGKDVIVNNEPSDDEPDVHLENVDVGGSLSFSNPRHIVTKNVTAEGGFSASNSVGGIRSWTIEQPFTALGGLPIEVVQADSTLDGGRYAWIGTFANVTIEDATVGAHGQETSIYVPRTDGNRTVEVRNVTFEGTQHTPIASRGGTLVVEDVESQPEYTLLDAEQATVRVRDVVVEGASIGLKVDRSDTIVENSILDVENEGIRESRGSIVVRDTRVDSGGVGISFGSSPGPGWDRLERSAIVAEGPAITEFSTAQVHAENCYLEGGRKPGGTFTSGAKVHFTVGAVGWTRIENCTIQHKAGINRAGEAIRLAPRGQVHPEELTVHETNIEIPSTAEHVDSGRGLGLTADLQNNWWGGPELPEMGGGFWWETDPVRFTPINEPPSVGVEETPTGWRLEVTDDRALVTDAGWILEDGERLPAEGRWPHLDTELSADRLGPGGHHVVAYATDQRGVTTHSKVALLVPDPSGDPTVVIDGPLNATQDDLHTLEARTAGSPTSIAWDVDHDGTVDATGATLEFTPSQPGTLDVAVTVEDDAGQQASDVVTLEVRNPPPEASIHLGSTPIVGETAELTAQASDNGAIANYTWDWHADGTADAQGPDPAIVPQTAGPRLVRLTVTDEDGASTTVSQLVTVISPEEPASAIFVETERPTAGHTLKLTASPTQDWLWDVGADGSIDHEGASLDWRFMTAGTHPVTLRFPNGSLALAAEVDVLEPQSLSFLWEEATVGEPTTLTAEGAGWDGYAWDLDGDGTIEANGPSATFIEQAPGIRNVTLTGYSGPHSEDVNRTVTIAAPNRTVEVGLTPARSPAPLNASLNTALDSPDPPEAWSLDEDGDGTIDAEGAGLPPAMLTLNASQPADYTGRLTVEWPTETIERSFSYTVLDPSATLPDIDLGLAPGDQLVDGETVTVTVEVDSDTPLDSYEVCGPTGCHTGPLSGTEATVRVPLQPPAGSHVVEVTVSDQDGNTALVQQPVTVEANQAPLLDVTAPAVVPAGQPTPLSVDAQDPEGRNVTIRWTQGGETYQGTPRPNLPPGTHPITVTATDPSGASASKTLALEVQDRLRLAADASPHVADPTRGIEGLEIAIQPTWAQTSAMAHGVYLVEYRPADGSVWIPVANETWSGGAQTVTVDRPFPPGEVRVTVTAQATEDPGFPVAPGGTQAIAIDRLVTGPSNGRPG